MGEATIRKATLEAMGKSVMESEDHFLRDHFGLPSETSSYLKIEGGRDPVSISLADLVARSKREIAVVLECAGNRRNEYRPEAPGLPWGAEAMSEAKWGGVALRNVLALAEIDPDATELVAIGSDKGIVRGGAEENFARSIPRQKALHPDTLIAVTMNGRPIPLESGGPIRLIVPGWYATDSVKWLHTLRAIPGPFQGHFQENEYRFALRDDPGKGNRLGILFPHSLVTSDKISKDEEGLYCVKGIAWGGFGGLKCVEVKIDDRPWTEVALSEATSPYARRFWGVKFSSSAREAEIAVRATDHSGSQQPEIATWNQKGYMNNSIHVVKLSI
jgi:DMSO/TMAO reductase YedYZ molybdopterin-dependent catalytic subunit